ncbi:hypothetical protein K402DRAFT_402127 [Aulographum hederae CBS 113979]|uniref:DUF7905 domain-containing protein n=1 Tax=Aulographum hederae CBS 113979 TaxID=1176131 RepID=A0A6G1H8W6_9PEZI|nr:hypothetical protein K402DRAFT_402127 [Aulographum hederae CBS 113979]
MLWPCNGGIAVLVSLGRQAVRTLAGRFRSCLYLPQNTLSLSTVTCAERPQPSLFSSLLHPLQSLPNISSNHAHTVAVAADSLTAYSQFDRELRIVLPSSSPPPVDRVLLSNTAPMKHKNTFGALGDEAADDSMENSNHDSTSSPPRGSSTDASVASSYCPEEGDLIDLRSEQGDDSPLYAPEDAEVPNAVGAGRALPSQLSLPNAQHQSPQAQGTQAQCVAHSQAQTVLPHRTQSRQNQSPQNLELSPFNLAAGPRQPRAFHQHSSQLDPRGSPSTSGRPKPPLLGPWLRQRAPPGEGGSPALLAEPDSTGRQLYREDKPVAHRIRLPPGFNPLARRNGGRQDRDLSISPSLDQIAVASGAHLILRRCGDREVVYIWGDPATEAHATYLIKDWIRLAVPNESVGEFSKVAGAFSREKMRLEKRIELEGKRQRYLQDPQPGQPFCKLINLKWPESTIRKLLGKNLEALDPIRMDCFCYIRFVSKLSTPPNGPCFQFMGKYPPLVDKACQRVQNIQKQIKSRTFDHQTWYLIKSSKQDALREKIALLPFTSSTSEYEPDQKKEKEAVKRVTLVFNGNKLNDTHFMERNYMIHGAEAGTTYAGDGRAASNNINTMLGVALPTLRILQNYRGPLQMRAHIGTFVLKNYRVSEENQYSLAQLEEMFNEGNIDELSNLQGSLTPDLGRQKLLPNLKDHFDSAGKVLYPTGDPPFSAIFIIADSKTAGKLRLEGILLQFEYHRSKLCQRHESTSCLRSLREVVPDRRQKSPYSLRRTLVQALISPVHLLQSQRRSPFGARSSYAAKAVMALSSVRSRLHRRGWNRARYRLPPR